MTHETNMNDLRNVLNDKLGTKYHNFGDVNYITYGGAQLKWQPERDSFAVVELYTPDYGIYGWEIQDCEVDLDDLLYSVAKPAQFPLTTEELRTVRLKDQAKSVANFIGKGGEWESHLEEATELNEPPSAEVLAELLVAIAQSTVAHGGFGTEHRRLVDLPNGMSLKDTYGDEEAAETFERLEAKAEGLLLEIGLDFEPDHNHLSEAERTALAADTEVLAEKAEKVSYLLTRGAKMLRQKDEPMARRQIAEAKAVLGEISQVVDAIIDREYPG